MHRPIQVFQFNNFSDFEFVNYLCRFLLTTVLKCCIERHLLSRLSLKQNKSSKHYQNNIVLITLYLAPSTISYRKNPLNIIS